MSRASLARALTLAGLATQLAVLLWPPASAVALAGAVPLAILLVLGMRPAPRWGGWVAVLAIPYLSVAVMNLMSGPAGPVVSSLLAIGAVVAFFAGLDWTRRRGFSLR